MAEQIKFYFDEHIPKAVADGLKRRSIDILTTQSANRRGLPDSEQLTFAFQTSRVLVTMDSDFIVLAAAGIEHAGIAYAQPQRRSIGELIQSLILIYETLEPDDMKNHVEYL